MRNVKKKVIIFTGHYLPGYKSGGILRNVLNTVNNLSEYCEFRIVTSDRDLGDDKAYEAIFVGRWIPVGNALVYYLPENGANFSNLKKILEDTEYDVIFLTSCFDRLTVKILFIRILTNLHFGRVIVAPFGEFAWASFNQKLLKKLIFLGLARLIGLYDGVIWRVSSKFEAKDLDKVMSPPKGSVIVTGDLPTSFEGITQLDLRGKTGPLDSQTDLKIIFLSRISQEKNLDVALQILMHVKARIVFDIYGPIENSLYWLKCKNMILDLPSNITARYCKTVPPSKILDTFSNYDLFLFPTGGEAYGNVIAESLIAGTQVLISDKTPWRNLENDTLGWEIDLNRIDQFIKVIDKIALTSPSDRFIKRDSIKNAISKRLSDPWIIESNLKLFGIIPNGD